MLLGMGVVYAFLYILVLLTGFQAKIINRYFPDKKEAVVSSASSATASVPALDADEEESRRIAAITAAIMDFRKNK
ncbi:MAG: OadG family protein [Campylobacterales bacterium]|nr:OadG family protein [Campylobacterales bacterium]